MKKKLFFLKTVVVFSCFFLNGMDISIKKIQNAEPKFLAAVLKK